MKIHVLIICVWIVIIFIIKDIIILTNVSFYTGLISIWILAIIYLMKSELFRWFFKGFKILWGWVTPENRGMVRAEEIIKNDDTFQQFKMRFHQGLKNLLLWIGCYALVVSILFAFIQIYNH